MSQLPITKIRKETNQQVNEDQDETAGRKKQKKVVTFHEAVRSRSVESFLDEDPSVLWYSPKDYETARAKERSLRCYIRKTEKNEGNLNAQGILTLEEAARKRNNGASAKIAVFEQQEAQEIAFLVYNDRKTAKLALDGEQIAKAYQPHSQASLAQAQHRAMTHETHVHTILSDPTEELIAALPNRRRRSPRSSLLLSSPRSIRGPPPSLIRRGKRFQICAVLIPGASSIIAGVTSHLAA
ncbi:unnamed protein product [Cylindrotheca closterium]|uniref:Uncharacterized protein n=1 Tax=Cylindrotheca closterium TaxID=2856 RepID=A0AAD2FED1_9STRA|nr:unnamed protein product [Cylindrotheca closterium]